MPATPALSRVALLGLLLLLAACDGARLETLARGSTVLAFGDSLTFGTGAPPEASYPEVLAGLTGLVVVNAGVPGEVTAEGRRRLPGLLREHAPDLVILTHGGNDTLRKLSPEQTVANLGAMVETVRAAGAQVVMLGVPGRNLALAAPGYYEDVAARLEVPIDAGTLPRLMRDRSMKSDPVHLNERGYAAMAAAVAELLRDAGALPDAG